jgi:hypothetical protein
VKLGWAGHRLARQGWALHGTGFTIQLTGSTCIMEIKIHISGVTPLICNRYGEEAAMAATNGSRDASAAQDRGTPQEIARKKLYIGLDGHEMIPQPNLLRCLVEGGRFTKVGKAQITTKTSSMMYACLDIQGAEVRIKHTQPWKVDTRAVRIPSTGGRILAHRPMFDDWRLEFVVDLDTSIMSESVLRKIVDDAGSRIGLGDFRPQCKGPYGRFRVDLWQVVQVRMAAD